MIRTIAIAALAIVAINHFALCEKEQTAIEVRQVIIETTNEVADFAASQMEKAK